jgi:hypothetical protein
MITARRPLRLHRVGALCLGVLLAAPMLGCDPPLDPETYGRVIYQIPQIPGSEKPYPLPQLAEPEEDSPKPKK